MTYDVEIGELVKISHNDYVLGIYNPPTILKVLEAPEMNEYFAKKGERFGYIKCEVIECKTNKWKVGDIHDFNGDFIEKLN